MRRIAAAQGGFGHNSSHVMPARAGAVAGIYGYGFIRPISLMRKGQRIKADINGLPH